MIGIIEYGAGNIFSLQASLERLQLPYSLITKPEDITQQYDKFIVPGVGHAQAAKDKLLQKDMWNMIPKITKPVLGICIGMQMLSQFSEEGDVELLGIVPAKTTLFPKQCDQKVPHMGWNTVIPSKPHPLFEGIDSGAYFYFVHSYFVAKTENNTLATTHYIQEFSSAVIKDNFLGVQFHPEKSGEAGAKLLENFARL